MEEVKQAITIKKEKQEATNKHELPVTVWNSLHETPPLHETAPPPVKVESLGIISKVEEEADSDISEAITIKQEEQEVTNKDGQHELPVTVWNSLHETTPLHETAPPLVNHINSKVKEEADSDISEAITIKQEEQEVNIKEEQQDFPVTAWSALHENPPPPVKVESSGIFINIKMEDKSDSSEMDDIQTVSSAVQESVKAPLTKMKEDDSISLTLKSKPSDISELCMARERSVETQGRNPAEIEVCLDFEDLSSSKQDMLRLHTLQELQAKCTEKREMTSLPNEQDKMTSLSLSMQQSALQKLEHYSHVQEKKNTINDSRLCNQTKDYTIHHVADNDEKRESNTHQTCNIQSNVNNIQKTPSKKQRQTRYFQDQWRQKYLVDYDWKAEEVVCLVCGLRMRCLRSCTFERHAQRRHPESILYSKETRNALWESWNKGQHSFPLLNAASGMSDFKVCSNRMESQTGFIKHCDPGLQEWQEDCKEELEIKRLQAMQDKLIPIVQHNDRLPVQQKAQKCLYAQQQQSTINESRVNNQTEYSTIQCSTHLKQPDSQHIWNTHRKKDMPQLVLKKQKQMRNFQEHWRQKYLVDYDWKTEQAVCILCGLRMRSLRSCTLERHAQRRHPESVHYPEKTRNALLKTWNKEEHIYPLCHAGSTISDTNMCQEEMKSQPNWQENHEPSMNAEDYMAIQQEQIESVLKSTNSQHEVYS
ncbi:uncharacterized protein [Aquarana catesbeiana]|uniref:uncharacterized protein isoform X3 n=1 Tax=Aquarana catesbeiana TaxID=8400 RepID=UPI003CC9ED5D